MKSNLNRNISVWRGNNTPPTEYHLWIKDDGQILIKVIDGSGTAQWITKNTGDSTTIQNVNTLEEALQYLQTQSTLQIQQGSIIKFKDNGKWSEYICVGTPVTDLDNWKILSQENKIIDLQEQTDDIQEQINELQIVEVNPESNNIESSYQLQDREGNNKGVTINIPKDKSIKDVQVLDTNATIDEEGNLNAGDPIGTTALCIVYITADGTYRLAKLDYSKFIEETEYGNGLIVEDHIISIKLNTEAQTSKYINLDANGLGIKGIDEEIEKHTTNITSDQISNGAITTDKLANNSVSTDKIIDGAVTANKLADSVIKLNELPGEDETSIKTYELRINNIDQTLIGKIDIPKDQHLVDVKVSDTNATLNDSGLIVDGDPKGTTALVLSYYLEDGTYKIAKLDYQRFIEEAEIGNGLDIVDGKVVIKLDSNTQTSKYLQVTDSGIGVKGIDEAIEAAKTSVDFIKTTVLTSEDDIESIESTNKLKVNTWNDSDIPNNVPRVEYGTPPQVSNPNGSILSIGDGNGNNTLIFFGKSSYTPSENRAAIKRQGETGGWSNLLQSKTLDSTYSDFNEIKDSGIYFLNSSFPSILNAPEDITLDYGYLIVTSDDYDHFTQTFISADGVIATRYNNGQSSNYNNWNIIRPSYQIIPSGSDLSTYNKSGVYLFGEDSLSSYTGLGTLSSNIFDSSKSIGSGSKLVVTNNGNGFVTQVFYIYDSNSNDLTVFHRQDNHNGGSIASSSYFLDYSSNTLNNSLTINSTGLVKNSGTALTNEEKDTTFKQLSRGLELLYKGQYIDQSDARYSNYILFGKVSETFNMNGQIILQRSGHQYNICASIYFAVSVTHNLPNSDTRREASFHILTNGKSADGQGSDSNILRFKILQVTVDGEDYIAGWIPDIMGGNITIYGIQRNVSKTSQITVANTRDNTITDGDIICDRDIMYDVIGKGQLPNDFTDWGVATSDIDLNTYNTDSKLGYYIAQGGSSVTNAPTGVTLFGLLVLRAAGTNYAQILYAEDKIYYRNYTNSAWTSWVDLTKDTTYNNATTTTAGLMSANDKVAVDSIAYKRYTLDLAELDNNTFYPVVLKPTTYGLSLDCEVNSRSQLGTHPYNLNRVKFSLTSKGSYDEKETFTLWNAYNFDNNEITIGSIGYFTTGTAGCCVLFVRGGTQYYFNSNANSITVYEDSYTNSTGGTWTVTSGSSITGGDNVNVKFYWKNDSTRDTNEYINAKYDDVYGLNTVTTLESTPVTKKLVVANLTESEILSLAADLPAGHELHIIINNTSDGNITVTLPYDSYTNAVTQALELAANTPMTLPLDNPEL